jgi:hypothetical protein
MFYSSRFKPCTQGIKSAILKKVAKIEKLNVVMPKTSNFVQIAKEM